MLSVELRWHRSNDQGVKCKSRMKYLISDYKPLPLPLGNQGILISNAMKSDNLYLSGINQLISSKTHYCIIFFVQPRYSKPGIESNMLIQ